MVSMSIRWPGSSISVLEMFRVGIIRLKKVLIPVLSDLDLGYVH